VTVSGYDRALSAMKRGPLRPAPRDGRPVVLYHSPWQRPDDGWSICARANARAMHMGGIDVHLYSWNESPSGKVDPEVIDALPYAKLVSEWDLHVFSAALFGAEKILPAISHLKFDREPQAFHAMFERQYIEPAIVDELNQLRGVWAQCGMNHEVLTRCGVKNSTFIPFPYFDDDPHLEIPPPKESRRFYYVGRFEPRKAPDNLIRAFMRAFRPGEASLTLKLSAYAGPQGNPYVTPEEVIDEGLGKNNWTAGAAIEWIRIIRGRLSKRQMLELHASHDVYASASRGEGIGLPELEAKLSGRQVVTTDSGGPRDFLNDGDVLVPATGLIPFDESYEHGPGACYSAYDLDALVAALQEARAGTPVGSRVPETHRAEHVGKRMREWVEEILG